MQKGTSGSSQEIRFWREKLAVQTAENIHRDNFLKKLKLVLILV